MAPCALYAFVMFTDQEYITELEGAREQYTFPESMTESLYVHPLTSE